MLTCTYKLKLNLITNLISNWKGHNWIVFLKKKDD